MRAPRLSGTSIVLAAVLLTSSALPGHAQPGYGMDLPSLSGDPLDTGALNIGFNNLAVTMQMRTFLLSNPAFIQAAQADAEKRQKLIQEARAELQARGEAVIANGEASTRYALQDEASVEPDVRKLFGARGETTPLVPVDLQAFRRYAGQRGLAQDDVADAAAITTAICYEIYTGQIDAVHDRALADMRQRASEDLLADPIFQGMSDHDRQAVYEVLAVWIVAAVADYAEFTNRLAQPAGDLMGSTRQSLQRLRATCGTVLQQSLGVAPESIHITPTGLSLDG
jgi:hypothetical protein